MRLAITLAPGAEDNGLATMLAELVRQNIEAKPHKKVDFDGLCTRGGVVAIVAVDAEVALTMRFGRAGLVVHDGIVGIPDATVRGTSDVIINLSNLPITTPLALPIPGFRDEAGKAASRAVNEAMRSGDLEVHGALLAMPLLLRLTRLMSVNG